MGRGALFVGSLLLVLTVIGCGNSDFKDDGVSAGDRAAASSANAIAVSVDGNYDKLTPDQKKQFITLAGGSEGQARRLCNIMAHPPIRGGNSAVKGGALTGPHPPGS